MTKYRNLLEVAEAVHDGRVTVLAWGQCGGHLIRQLLQYKTWDDVFDTDDHRMWFCLFVHEAMIWEATK